MLCLQYDQTLPTLITSVHQLEIVKNKLSALIVSYTVQLPNTDTSQYQQLPKTDHIYEEWNASLYIQLKKNFQKLTLLNSEHRPCFWHQVTYLLSH